MTIGPRDEATGYERRSTYRELDDGVGVIYDPDNPRAWIRSDTTVAIDR